MKVTVECIRQLNNHPAPHLISVVRHQYVVISMNGSNVRQRLVEVLELMASPEAQLAYQEQVPIADVPAELICMWDETFWINDPEVRAAFSADEWVALEKYDSIFHRVCALLPPQLPPLLEFQKTQLWLRLSRGAARALSGVGV